MKSIKEKYGEALPVSKNDSKDKLMGFLEEVLPNYSKDKVYPSNIKKLISWYNILKDLDVDYTVEEEEAEEAKEGEEKLLRRKRRRNLQKEKLLSPRLGLYD